MEAGDGRFGHIGQPHAERRQAADADAPLDHRQQIDHRHDLAAFVADGQIADDAFHIEIGTGGDEGGDMAVDREARRILALLLGIIV